MAAPGGGKAADCQRDARDEPQALDLTPVPDPNADQRQTTLWLLLGTGTLGGFTTYSALAADGAVLLGSDPTTGVLYLLGTLLFGGIAAFLGILLGSTVRAPRGSDAR